MNFTTDSGIERTSAVGTRFVPINHREKSRLLMIFDRKEITHLGAIKIVTLRGNKRPPEGPSTEDLSTQESHPDHGGVSHD